MNVLFARTVSFFIASLKLTKNQAWFFILCYIDFYRFDEKASWWYIKRKEMPDSVGRLHISAIKPPLFRERAALLFNSFYLLSKKGLSE